jgi:hypothetical protein
VTREKITDLKSNHSEGSTPVAICTTSIQNTLPGGLVESLKGGLFGEDCIVVENDAAR